jgi:hypothetical protein
MAAASGALREMSGNFDHNVRAAERFLSTSLGLGPVLQAAFPLVGALAFGGVLVDVGEKLVKFGGDAAELGRELGGSWLDGAVAQVTGLAKELKQADEELMKLAEIAIGPAARRKRRTSSTSACNAVRYLQQADRWSSGPETLRQPQQFSKAAPIAGRRTAGRRRSRAAQLQNQIDALEKIKQLQLRRSKNSKNAITAAERQAAQERGPRGDRKTNTIGQSPRSRNCAKTSKSRRAV